MMKFIENDNTKVEAIKINLKNEISKLNISDDDFEKDMAKLRSEVDNG